MTYGVGNNFSTNWAATTDRKFFLKNGPTSASFSFIFGLFKQTIEFLQQINVKKCIQYMTHRDSNPRPLEHESSPLTTTPVLPPLWPEGCSSNNCRCIQVGATFHGRRENGFWTIKTFTYLLTYVLNWVRLIRH